MTRRDVDHAALAAGTRRVLELLEDGRWHTSQEIEDVCHVTAHSRLADLRGAGYVLDKRSNPRETGRRKFSYRLIATAEEATAALEQPDTLSPLPEGESGCSSDDRSQSTTPGRQLAGPAGRDDVDTVPPPPFSDPHELEDAGWRELFSADSVAEALPPPVDEGVQLQLGGMRP